MIVLLRIRGVLLGGSLGIVVWSIGSAVCCILVNP